MDKVKLSEIIYEVSVLYEISNEKQADFLNWYLSNCYLLDVQGF